MDGVDLGGKIIFKVKLDKEIKKVIIHNDEINYNEMLLMIQRIFSDRIKPNDEFRIKYADDENDLITIANDSDLAVAIQTTKILKLTIYLDGKEEKVEEIKASEIVGELRQLRTSVDSFLNKFERFLKLDAPAPKTSSSLSSQNKAEETNRPNNTAEAVKTSSSSTIIHNDIQKEFDPLLRKGDLEAPSSQKFQPIQKNSRAETPDSIGSSEFSLSQKVSSHMATITVGAGSNPGDLNASNVNVNNNNNHYDAQQQQYQLQQQHLVNQVQVQQQQHMQNQQQFNSNAASQQQFNPQQHQQHGQYNIPHPPQIKYPNQLQQPPQIGPVNSMMPHQQPAYPGQPQQPQQQQQPGVVAQQQAPPPQPPQQQQGPYQPPPPQQQQQFYNSPQQPLQQQQQLQPVGPQATTIMGMSPLPGGYPTPQAPQPAMANPYSNKINPNASSLARPPSAQLYQQGYK